MTGPIHSAGHTLDLGITRAKSSLVHKVTISDPGISDHRAITLSLHIQKPPTITKQIHYRKIKAINADKFINDLNTSALVTQPLTTLADLLGSYDKVLTSTLDNHAPVRTKTVTVRPECKWFNNSLGAIKRDLRKLEQVKNNSGLAVHELMFQAAAKDYRKAKTRRKIEYFNSLISESSDNQGSVFRIADTLLHKSSEPTLPAHDDPVTLAQDFLAFFDDKVAKIKSSLPVSDPNQNLFPEPPAPTTFSTFKLLSQAEVLELVKGSPIKACPLDPVPASLFKACLPALLPTLTSIVNLSLQSGVIPASLKAAQLSPIIKKANLDPESLSNY